MPLDPTLPFLFRPRGYLHLDAPMSQARAQALVNDATAVSRHPFLPFILAEVTTQKIRKRAGGGVELRPPKVRPIAYAGHADSHIFANYSAMYERRYEQSLVERGLAWVVTAFRRLPGRCNIDFANEVFEFIRCQQGHCFVLASDITDFFNQLDHRILKNALRGLLGNEGLPADHYAVFKAITRYCTVDRAALYRVLGLDAHPPRDDRRYRLCTAAEFRERVRGSGLCVPNTTGRGIPQGSPISAILANLYLLEFDTLLNEFVARHGGLYRRYCDDLLLVLPTEELRAEAMMLLRAGLQRLGLEAHRDKTELLDYRLGHHRLHTLKPLNYLGFTFDGVHKRIRPASVARYYRKMRRGVARAKAIRHRVHDREGGARTRLRRRQLHVRYSYLGRHNFTSYVFRAARVMNDDGIKRQISGHWQKLQTLIADAD